MDKNTIVLMGHYFIIPNAIPNVITKGGMILAILKFCRMF